jgi:ParB-like chromosome segregation protein Spo0J
MMAKEIVYRKLSDLKKLPNNPRTIKKDDMERLKKSIKDNPDYFEARPIILSNRTGELVILAGNQRYEAAKALKMDEVPTFLLEGLTEAREREIIIRDNVSNGDWDFDILANEFDIDDLEKWGVDNIKKSISDEKEIEEKPPTIVTSFITFDYNDEIALSINDETAVKLVGEMVNYRKEHGTYDGFWDSRLS